MLLLINAIAVVSDSLQVMPLWIKRMVRNGTLSRAIQI
jgi:hypothetical protein